MTDPGPEMERTPPEPDPHLQGVGRGSSTRNRTGGLLIIGAFLVLAVQFFLSARVFLPTPHNGGDNAGYIALAHSLVERGAYLELWDPQEPVHTKYPPVFPLLLAGLMALGVKGWVGLKAVPFVSTLLAGLFTFLWVRGRGGILMGMAVALILALSDGVLYYSHWILSDPTFLALTMGALWALERAEKAGDGNGPSEEDEGAGDLAGPRSYWMVAGLILVLLAYFTRSAGLPLVIATLLCLLFQRRRRALISFTAVFFATAGPWWLWGRLRGGSEYVAEFWLLDPYRPELGRVGLGDLVTRVWENLVAYSLELVPQGILGGGVRLIPVLGVALVILGILGWARSVRNRPRAAELFFPLYGGLMLLWPQVWSGDRFALPLIPLLLFFAGKMLRDLLKRGPTPLRVVVPTLAFLLLALPAGLSWLVNARVAAACREVSVGSDPWTCESVYVREYVLMAEWAGNNLPEGAVVVTRKPRIFYVQSGVKTVSLPFTSDAGTFLATAESKGARYVTLDRWDSLAGYYLYDVVTARPDAFCSITGVEIEGEMGIQLLGLWDWDEDEGGGGDELYLLTCPMTMVTPEPRERSPVPPGVVPLLALDGE